MLFFPLPGPQLTQELVRCVVKDPHTLFCTLNLVHYYFDEIVTMQLLAYITDSSVHMSLLHHYLSNHCLGAQDTLHSYPNI